MDFMKRIVYIELGDGGHSQVLLNAVATCASQDPDQYAVTYAVSEALMTNCINDSDTLRIVPRSSFAIIPDQDLAACRDPRLWLAGLRQWQLARRLIREHSADHAIIMFFDHALIGSIFPWSHVGRSSISGVLFRPVIHFDQGGPDKSGWKSDLKVLAKSVVLKLALRSKAIGRIFALDEYFSDYAKKHLKRGEKVVFLPDLVAVPTDIVGSSCSKSNPDSALRFLLFGALTERKGLFLLLEALSVLPENIKEKMHLTLAGRISPDNKVHFQRKYKALLQAHPDLNIIVKDHFLSEPELIDEVRNTDVILAPYINHVGSSGVLYWAASARKPVITQNTGLIGRQLEERRLGIAINTSSVQELAKAIEQCVRGDPKAFINRSDAEEFCRGHTPEDFGRTILENL